MMTLKNLIVYTDATANQFLKHWSYDPNTLKFWRASSNYVYAFQCNGKRFFLRFSNEEDNSIEQIMAELDLMEYLKTNNYPVVYPIRSKHGKYIETVSNENGTYYGVVFSKAIGVNLDILTMTGEQFENWGKALASLHDWSVHFKPKTIKRRDYKEVLRFIDKVLNEFSYEQSALVELERVTKWLDSLPITPENYGLIHYDFETDNVFWDEQSKRFNVIDFDDSMYHWYIMDIASALSDLEELENDKAQIGLERFIKGYRSIRELDKDLLAFRPRFQRFADLFCFAKLLRTLKDSDFKKEPDWLQGVRKKLLNKCDLCREGFKKPW